MNFFQSREAQIGPPIPPPPPQQYQHQHFQVPPAHAHALAAPTAAKNGFSSFSGDAELVPLPPIYTGGAILSCELGGGLPIADTFARAQTSSAGVAC